MSEQLILPLDQFWDRLRFRSITFDFPDEQTGSGTGGGEVLRASRGDILWEGKASLVVRRHDQQDQIKALMDEIRHGGAAFFVCDPKRRAPQFDKSGALQGASEAQILSVDENDRRHLVLGGLPYGFEVSPGDLVSFEYGSNPVRYFLARVQQGGTFSGVIPKCRLRVLPFLPSGLVAGLTVRLRDPICKAVYVPNSYTPIERTPAFDSGFEFNWRQTYR